MESDFAETDYDGDEKTPIYQKAGHGPDTCAFPPVFSQRCG